MAELKFLQNAMCADFCELGLSPPTRQTLPNVKPAVSRSILQSRSLRSLPPVT